MYNFSAFFFKLTHFDLQLNTLYAIANQQFWVISSTQYGRLKKRKTVKTKMCANSKTKRQFL